MMKSRYKILLCALFALAIGTTLYADTMKPDILDVQTTFKIAGVDKTNIVTATGTNTAIKMGVSSVTGSATVATGLTTVTGVVASLDSGSLAATKAHVVGTSSAGNITIKVYGTDTTTLASDAAVVHWFATGIP